MYVISTGDLHYSVSMWQWLQLNSGALQSTAALIGAIVGCFTVPVLLMTYFAARDAAAAARQQADAAKALTEVSKAQQIATERAAIAAEAQVEAANASSVLAREQLVAFQESAAAEKAQSELARQRTLALLRPALSFENRYSGAIQWVVLTNVSQALALSVRVFNGTPEEPTGAVKVSSSTIAPGADVRLEGIAWGIQPVDQFGRMTPIPVPIFALYRSQDGRVFTTVVEDLRRKPISQIDREELDSSPFAL